MTRLTSKSMAVTATRIADNLAFYLALSVVAVVLVSSLAAEDEQIPTVVTGGRLVGGGQPCDDIYVVGEGETLHTISDKCGDPFIVERNPHIHDPDDVFPGLVIMLQPSPHLLHRHRL